MRVALVTENFLPKLDGVTRTLAMLLDHLHHRGHQAIVLAPEGAPKRYAKARVFTARGVPFRHDWSASWSASNLTSSMSPIP
jgi:phosphatidylinositol alpha 1,6-mannosyltransferase